MVDSSYYSAEDLKSYCSALLTSAGLPEKDASVVSDSLIRADLEDSGTHGISRLSIYMQRIKEGRIKSNPNIKINKTGSVLTVDGDNGLGQVVASEALDRGVELVKQTGIAGLFISNSNHFGTAAYFCEKACEKNLAIIATTNAQPGIAPWGGKEAYFGTNPIAFGFPTPKEGPVIVDLSSSIVARGNVILADREGESIPDNWAFDEHGVGTTCPSKALKGSMRPVGDSKGYALAMAVELLAGVLTGAAFGPHVHDLYQSGNPPSNVGHSFILINISNIMNHNEYFSRIYQLINEIKQSPLKQGVDEILYPGERRYRAYINNKKRGISLSNKVKQELSDLGVEQDIKFPDPISTE